MKPDCKKTKTGQLNNVDRFSDLPDFILHHIISFLGTTEAYRTSILSKRWAHISATNPILEFHYYCKAKNSPARYWPSKEVSAKLLGYMDTRLQRYSIKNLRVRTLILRFPDSDQVLGCDVEETDLSSKVDEWIRIAVRNQVEILDLDGPSNYQLPDILLSAKSLRRLDCSDVEIPYYNKAVNLESLQTLVLFNVVVEERMLNHIISSSRLLNCLSVEDCFGFDTMVIPSSSQLKKLTLAETSLPKNRTFIIETSSITDFQFTEFEFNDQWPVMSKPGSLKNLRELTVSSSGITDEDLGKLLPELASLKILRLSECYTLKTFKISNTRLKEIYFTDCRALLDVIIDAPRLTYFECVGEFDPHRAITISSRARCDISIDTRPGCLDTGGFFKLKRLMTGLSSCNALKISLIDCSDEVYYGSISILIKLTNLLLLYTMKSVSDDIKFDEEELRDVNPGPPRNISALKLTLCEWILSRSSISAFLNGLFWTCHPRIISFRIQLDDPNLMIEHLKSELENMANCQSHPLKGVEGANCSNLLKSKDVVVQLKLHW